MTDKKMTAEELVDNLYHTRDVSRYYEPGKKECARLITAYTAEKDSRISQLEAALEQSIILAQLEVGEGFVHSVGKYEATDLWATEVNIPELYCYMKAKAALEDKPC